MNPDTTLDVAAEWAAACQASPITVYSHGLAVRRTEPPAAAPPDRRVTVHHDVPGVEWRAIPGTGGWYEVNDRREVRSWKAKGRWGRRAERPTVLTSWVNKKTGLVVTTIAIDGKPTQRAVDDLFRVAFPDLAHGRGRVA